MKSTNKPFRANATLITIGSDGVALSFLFIGLSKSQIEKILDCQLYMKHNKY